MLKRIRAEIATSPFIWIGKKLKAYQDDNKNYKDLTSWEKANVEADIVAKQHLDRIQNQPKPQHNPMQSEGWSVYLNNSILTTNFEKKIISHCTEENTNHYWYKCMQIPTKAQQYVDWATFKKTSALLTTIDNYLF